MELSFHGGFVSSITHYYEDHNFSQPLTGSVQTQQREDQYQIVYATVSGIFSFKWKDTVKTDLKYSVF